MELWLLGAGAIVLVGITLWIVWPARTTDPIDLSLQGKEVSIQPMTQTASSGPVSQSDRFADQYTTAMTDLSAGGGAAAIGEADKPPRLMTPVSRVPEVSPIQATVSAPDARRSALPRRRVGLGASAVLAVGGGVGGAWLYARWQRERNRPINRLRRGARDMAARLGGVALVAGGAYAVWRLLRRGQHDRSMWSAGG
jgi:hypothetical protein